MDFYCKVCSGSDIFEHCGNCVCIEVCTDALMHVYALTHRCICIMHACCVRICVRLLPICVTDSCAAPAGDVPLSPSLLPSFYQGHLTAQCPKGARHPPNWTDNTAAAEHSRAFLIKRYKRYEVQCVITKLHSFQNQRERQLKKASVSAELSLALWLKSWQPSVSGKTPLALMQSTAACWASRLRDGLQQTHEQMGCPTQMRYGVFSGKAANIC